MSFCFAPDARPSRSRTPHRLTAQDPRADGQHREILLSADAVTIRRRLNGIAMRVSVPVRAYDGVCVALRPTGSGEVGYEIRLAHRDADLSVSLAQAADDLDIWADWRSWARFFGLPALVERSDGMEAPGPARDGAAVASAVPAKRRSRRRRPAFITRRYTRPGAAAVVYRKAEIIAPE